jgi:Fic family protein
MTADDERPFVDAQSLSDTDLHIYEAIATLEQSGQPPTGDEIAAAAHLDGSVVRRTLSSLLERRVVVPAGGRDQSAFTLARHDWSSAPDGPAS